MQVTVNFIIISGKAIFRKAGSDKWSSKTPFPYNGSPQLGLDFESSGSKPAESGLLAASARGGRCHPGWRRPGVCHQG